jgi:hypothetical protein
LHDPGIVEFAQRGADGRFEVPGLSTAISAATMICPRVTAACAL